MYTVSVTIVNQSFRNPPPSSQEKSLGGGKPPGVLEVWNSDIRSEFEIGMSEVGVYKLVFNPLETNFQHIRSKVMLGYNLVVVAYSAKMRLIGSCVIISSTYF